MVRCLIALALSFAHLGLAQANTTCDTNYAKTPKALTALEDEAGRGALETSRLTCLQSAYALADKITLKDKISRVLLINAYAYNTRQWATLVDRHLAEIDQSDPAISYLYTFYLNNRSSPEYHEVIKWSEVALERRSVWTGRTYTNRTFQLMKVRAMAATALWDSYTRDNEPDKAQEMRLQAKTFSREWLDFAHSANWDTTEAESMCASAASKEACGIVY